MIIINNPLSRSEIIYIGQDEYIMTEKEIANLCNPFKRRNNQFWDNFLSSGSSKGGSMYSWSIPLGIPVFSTNS